MKVYAALLILSLLFFALPTRVWAATLSLEPSSGTFNQGCNFSLDIVLDTENNKQTDGTDAILIYDTSRFSGRSITNGPIYPDFPGNNINETTGKITISGLASVNTPFSGKGTLATINLAVKSNAPAGATQITFEFDPNNKGETRDSNVVERTTVAELLNSVTNGNYVIGTGPCSAQASPSPSAGTRTADPRSTPRGDPNLSTPSATGFTPIKTLPEGGTAELTSALAIVGGILTVLGILGLALL